LNFVLIHAADAARFTTLTEQIEGRMAKKLYLQLTTAKTF